MISGSLARRYARAVFELGNSQGNLEKLGSDLRAMAAAMKTSPELVDLLTNPAVKRADRKRVIDAIMERFSVHATSRNLIGVLLDGERMATVPAISRELDVMIEDKAGRVTAEITSAQELSAVQLASLTQALERLSGKKVAVSKKTDPAILGGVVAKVGDVIYDGSLRSQLRDLKDEAAKA